MIPMTNILIHLATLIFVVGLGKQFLDAKCQENYEQGVIDSTKGYKIELEESMKKAFRTGIEQGKNHINIEDELYSKKIYERIGEER
jgi:hypothetical protein